MREEIDFSSVERLTPRADSFNRVLARLDKQESNVIPFKVISGIALAASVVIVCVSVILSVFSVDTDTENMPMGNIVSLDDVAWYSSLGNEDSCDFEELEESPAISYLTARK